MLQALSKRMEAQTQRLNQLEALTTRNVATLTPWLHNDPQIFWEEFDYAFGEEGAEGREQIAAGHIIWINDGYRMRADLVYFQASKLMGFIHQLRADFDRRGLNFNVVPLVPQSRKAIKSLPAAAFKIIEKILKDQGMNTGSQLSSQLPEQMCPAFQHKVDVSNKTENDAAKWPVICNGKLEKVGQVDYMKVKWRTKL
eukprot:12416146-Karenia_brevis.AAC.1